MVTTWEKIKEFIPYTTAVIIFISLVTELWYYNHFNLDIQNYISITEIVIIISVGLISMSVWTIFLIFIIWILWKKERKLYAIITINENTFKERFEAFKIQYITIVICIFLYTLSRLFLRNRAEIMAVLVLTISFPLITLEIDKYLLGHKFFKTSSIRTVQIFFICIIFFVVLLYFTT